MLEPEYVSHHNYNHNNIITSVLLTLLFHFPPPPAPCMPLIFAAAPSVIPASETVIGYKSDLVLELRCTTVGDLQQEMSWFFDGEKLQDSLHYHLAGNGSLLVVNMTSSLAGEYLCKAESAFGSDNATVYLRYGGTYQ